MSRGRTGSGQGLKGLEGRTEGQPAEAKPRPRGRPRPAPPCCTGHQRPVSSRAAMAGAGPATPNQAGQGTARDWMWSLLRPRSLGAWRRHTHAVGVLRAGNWTERGPCHYPPVPEQRMGPGPRKTVLGYRARLESEAITEWGEVGKAGTKRLCPLGEKPGPRGSSAGHIARRGSWRRGSTQSAGPQFLLL